MRILNPVLLDGYVVPGSGAPRFELLFGKVIDYNDNGRRVIAKLKNGPEDKEETVVFQNLEGDHSRLLRERFYMAKIKKGSWISVLVKLSNYEKIVIEFRFVGLWRFPLKRREVNKPIERNVLLGNPSNIRRVNGGTCFNLVEEDDSTGKKYTRHIHISSDIQFKNVEKNCFVICVCGPERHFNYECQHWREIV